MFLWAHGHPGVARQREDRQLGGHLGRLVMPDSYSSVERTARAGVPWAADNGGYRGVDFARWERMLDRIAGLPGCLFVTCPDVIGEQGLTDLLWAEYAPAIICAGHAPAYVLQEDGCEYEPQGLPWGSMGALFIGGASDAFKLGEAARECVREAKRRGVHVHMGRVNSRRRAHYAAAIGCDTVDGTGASLFQKLLPDYLDWTAAPVLEVGA
jgi:hypothetical protein